MLATLSPNDEIFDRAYVPEPRVRNAVPLQQVPMPQDGLFEGLENIFEGNKKRGKKGNLSYVLSKEEMIQIKIAEKQTKIQR